MVENWTPVPGYEGLYEVSDLGRVKSQPRPSTRGGILSPVTRPDGRLRVTLSKEGNVEYWLVHRLVLWSFVGPCPDGMEACHWDDNARNNSLSNLRWGTSLANSADQRRNGKCRNGGGDATHFGNDGTIPRLEYGGTCKSGLHPWVDENIRVSGGKRSCIGCQKLASKKYRSQGLPPESDLHGTVVGYRRGCRCAMCIESGRSAQREAEKNRTRRSKNGVR